MTEADEQAILAAGLDLDGVRAQIARLTGPAPRTRIDRPCVVGDGIARLGGEDALGAERVAVEAVAAGRVSAFVPASGAASRMLGPIRAVLDAPDPHRDALVAAKVSVAVFDALDAMGIGTLVPAEARAALAAGDLGPAAAALLDALDEAPKGLIPFRRVADGIRTAFDDHLDEAARLVADRDGRVRAHFTVGEAHRDAFAAAAARAPAGFTWEIGFSVQDPATDTVSVDAAGALVREDDGRPLTRPGGHGALLGNLGSTRGDLVLVKNIDNIVGDAGRAEVVRWRRRLLGVLVGLEAEVHGALARLDTPAGLRAGAALAAGFGRPVPEDAAAVRAALWRPLRVCGMVPDDGQPGGGPYWVPGPEGCTPQIVEAAQLDRTDPDQAGRMARATHFNPVDLAVALRDPDGRPWDLAAFVDPDACFVSAKTHHGTPIKVLEWPGLWNGAMARWNTVFVEIPRAVFQPVKTVADLIGR